tara:strand:- start:6408 stop:8030 length:1623 start_codon:yes stop_codon:yes gene_type:complete
MSFWTGFTTGLASSVDKGLQKAIEKRDGELSAAKNFWMQRKATKLEKAEEKKEAYDEKADKAFDILAGELGDTSFARAVMQKLGGPDEALAYIQKVNDTRATLQPGEKYSMVDDFKGYVAPKTEVTAEQNREAVRMKMPSMGQVTAEDLAVDDPIARLFGQDSKLATRAAETINTRFADVSKIDSTPISDVGTIAQVDLSRQIAAKEAAYTQVTRGREDTRFNIEVSAAKQNTSRIDQAMKIADAAEKRAVSQFASDEDQRKLENARAEVAALQRQTTLIQQAEAHVKDMELKDLSIEEAKAEAQKRKEHPIFKSYEDMAVYATQKLAAGNLTEQQEADFNRMYTDAIAGANAYNTATSDEGGTGVEFAKQSLDSMVEAARKLELEKIPTKSIGDKVEMVIKGNEATYYGGMERALNTVANRLTPAGGTMPAQAQRYIESLRADNTQKAYGYATSQASEYANALANNKSTDKINYVPFNVVDGAVNTIKSNNQDISDGQALKMYAQENLKPGAVVPMDDSKTTFGIWTGTKFVKATDMGR